jgi:hypothetical protein
LIWSGLPRSVSAVTDLKGVSRWAELERRSRVLTAEAACVVAAGGLVEDGWLATVTPWLAAAAGGGWEDLFGVTPDQRCYRRITASPDLEAWMIFWPQGGRLRLHDHGGASGALTVVAGALQERYLPRGRGPARQRRVGTGEGVSFDGAYIHDVFNTEEAPASSVHIYSAASRPMGFYALDGVTVRPLPTLRDVASIVEHDDPDYDYDDDDRDHDGSGLADAEVGR